MDYYITKDKVLKAFKYKQLKSLAWSYFPDGVKTQKDMLTYLNYGRDPNISLVFLDKENKEVTYYSVLKNKREAIENFDPRKRILIEDEAFMPLTEQIDYLKQSLSDSELDNEIEILKRKADAPTLEALKALINERKTEENIQKFCQEHILKYNKGKQVIVEFE